jgi:ATP-binding cassette subfamily B protein
LNLYYTLPDDVQQKIQPMLNGKKIAYCLPLDLNIKGEFTKDGWTVVTYDKLFVINDNNIEIVELSKVDEIICSDQVNCGILIARHNNNDRILSRFSMRYISQYSYVARGATLFFKGDNRKIENHERENYCSKCGKVLPGTNKCPRCAGASRMFKRFWNLCGPYALPLLCITLFMAVSSAITVGQQFIQRRFIDNVLVPSTGTAGQIVAFFLTMLFLAAAALALTTLNTIWSNSLGTKISRDLRARVYAKINQLSLEFINSRHAGELMNRVVRDSSRIREFMEHAFAQMFTRLFIMAGAFITMLVMNWKLALLTLVFVPIAFTLIRAFKRLEMRLWRQQWRFDDKVNGRLQDVISGIRVVKTFGQEQRETERFKSYIDRMTYIQRRNEVLWATLYPFVTFIITSGTFLIYYFGGRDVLNANMTPGQLVQFIAYANMLFMPLQFVSRLPRMIMRLKTSLERIYDILGEEPKIDDAPDAVDIKIKGDVEFKNITFGYKSYQPVLENINLSVKKGEMIGLVGSSGTGKSTMINLLMRLYDPDDGSILIDGMPITKMSKKSLHGQIGVVLQETQLFSGTLIDNIRYANPNATRLEVIKAAKIANAHDFIAKFPNGYDTYVGEHGYRLSGGERQRIAIARAILHDPQILILDEATSSLDTETEYQIQEALNRLTAGRTTFAIAHRLSTLRKADRIVVLDNHTIAEVGSHNQLMRQKGIYYGLVMAQLDMHRVRK